MAVYGYVVLPDVTYGDTWDGATFTVGGSGISGQVADRVRLGLKSEVSGEVVVLDSEDNADDSIFLLTLAAGNWEIIVNPRPLPFPPGKVLFSLETTVGFVDDSPYVKTYVRGEFEILVDEARP